MDPELEKRNQEQSEEKNDVSRDGYKSSSYQKEYRQVGRSQRPRIHSQRAYSNPSDEEGGFRPEGFGEKLHQSSDSQQ